MSERGHAPAAGKEVGVAATTDARQLQEPGSDLSALQAELAATECRIRDLEQALAAAQARERALAYELQHRVRNMLAVIRSIYRRTRENGASQEEFAEHFQGRLDAVARYQLHVDEAASFGVELEEIIRDELLQFHCLDGPNCSLNGPTIYLGQKQAELVGLAIHELTTNSIKFGALAQDGKLSIEWSATKSPDGMLLNLRWIETGVSLISSAPRPYGFGRQLIEEALPYQLNAETAFAFRPGGLECSILLPLPEQGAP